MIRDIKLTKTTSFKVFYDADDKELSSHSIDAKTLGRSITAMADLVEKSDELLNNGRQTVKFLVTNPSVKGSMGIAYTLIQIVPDAIDVMKTIGLTGLTGSAAYASTLSLVRQLGSKRIISITKKVGTNVSVLEFDDQEIECNDNVAKLVTDPTIRSAIVNLVHGPLNDKDDPNFKIVDSNDKVVFELDGKEETEEIRPLPSGSLLQKDVETNDVNVKFVQVNFDAKTGWRVEYKNEQFSVSLEDEVFLNNVRSGAVKFSNEDMFVVSLETIKTFSARGVSSKHTVKKVIRHRVATGNKVI